MPHSIPEPREELSRLQARLQLELERRGQLTDHDPYVCEVRWQEEAVAAQEGGLPLTDTSCVRERIRLHGRKPYGTPIAVVWDGWRSRHRVLLSGGACASCGRPTGHFTDGENDPRGSLGDYAASPMDAHDDWPFGEDQGYEQDELIVPACFNCQNEEPLYRRLQESVERAAERQPSRATIVAAASEGRYEHVSSHDPESNALLAWLDERCPMASEEEDG